MQWGLGPLDAADNFEGIEGQYKCHDNTTGSDKVNRLITKKDREIITSISSLEDPF